jgi:type IV pilus assembly protein PilA
VYLGVQNNAKDSAVQSDITNLKTAAISLQTTNGALPAKFAAINGTTGTPTFPVVGTGNGSTTAWADSGATVGNNTKALSYGPSATDSFCIIGESTSGKTFYATGSKGVSTTACTQS